MTIQEETKYSPFSYRVTQRYIPITKQYTTPLNRHLDGPGTTMSYTSPAALPSFPWKSLTEAWEVFKCPAFCLHKSKIVSEAPAMYYLHLITREQNRQNTIARQASPVHGWMSGFQHLKHTVCVHFTAPLSDAAQRNYQELKLKAELSKHTSANLTMLASLIIATNIYCKELYCWNQRTHARALNSENSLQGRIKLRI